MSSKVPRAADGGSTALDKGRHVLPAAAAGNHIRDVFSAQTLSSRKAPTRKKILRGYFNSSPKCIGSGR